MVHLAALTAGFYRALVARGVLEGEARRLTAGVTWLVYEKLAAVPWTLSVIAAQSQAARLERTMRLVRGFPFQAPSYQRVDLTAGSDVVAFDVLRCPVADYLRAQGLSQLCVDAWCNLDGPLASKWGARLERTGTLAQGAPRCDFRWHFGP